MRILIKEGRSFVIKEVEEVKMSRDKSSLIIPKQKKKYITGEKTEELFAKIISEGYADLSEFDSDRHVSQCVI